MNEEIIDEDKQSDGGSVEHLTLEYLKTKLTDKEIEFFKCRTNSDSVKATESEKEESSREEYRSIQVKNDIEEESTETIKGKLNSAFWENSGFSISCHNFPNAINHQRNHPDILLKPGQVYENSLTLKFGVRVKKNRQRKNEEANNFREQFLITF